MLCSRVTDRGRERHGFPCLPVHVDADEFASCGDLAGFGVAHLMQEADRLVADFQEPAPDLDDIAGQQLALVGDGCCTAAMPRPDSRK
jgi:hypothetical protein